LVRWEIVISFIGMVCIAFKVLSGFIAANDLYPCLSYFDIDSS